MNDLYAFDTESEQWEKLEAVGNDQPGGRGGTALLATANKIYVFGIYETDLQTDGEKRSI